MIKKKIWVNFKKFDIEKFFSLSDIKVFREYMLSDVSDTHKWALYNAIYSMIISSIDFCLCPLGKKKKICQSVCTSLREFFSDCLPNKSSL